tara:strand:- start:32 stop:223 length:192 start_codon:yes stop_codon:yes gene_type:complete
MVLEEKEPELIPGVNELVEYIKELEVKNRVLTEERDRLEFKCERLTLLYEELDQKLDTITKNN